MPTVRIELTASFLPRRYSTTELCGRENGADSENRTHIYSLEDCSNSHYTIPALFLNLR